MIKVPAGGMDDYLWSVDVISISYIYTIYIYIIMYIYTPIYYLYIVYNPTSWIMVTWQASIH